MAEEHKTKIVVEGDTAGAVASLGKVSTAFKALRMAASKVTQALGLIGFAIHGVQAIIEGYKRVTEWLNASATAAKRLQEALEADRHAAAISSIADKYKRLNDEIKRTADLETKLSAIEDKRTARRRDEEDARIESEKQEEIANINPLDGNYEAKKSEIERKYERRASDLAAARASEDSFTRVNRLNEQADMKDKEAARLEKLLITARGEKTLADTSGDDKASETASKKVNELIEAIAAAKYDATMLRAQSEAEYGSGEAARVRNVANQQRITNAERGEEVREYNENRKKVEEKNTRWADFLAKQSREESQSAELAALEKRKEAILAFGDGQSETGLSANRLSALGLGGGVENPNVGMGRDVKNIVKLLEKQIEETKKQHQTTNAHIAIFGE